MTGESQERRPRMENKMYGKNEVWKFVLRSSCCGTGVHQVKVLERVKVVGANYSQVRWAWEGIWYCNACVEPCNPYEKKVRNRFSVVKLGHVQCGAVMDGQVPSERKTEHIQDVLQAFRSRECDKCGAPAGFVEEDRQTQSYFDRLLKSKKATFRKCLSKDIARDELKCPHWEDCRHTSEKPRSEHQRNSWAAEQEDELDKTRHVQNCPARIVPPKRRIGYAAKPKKTLLPLSLEELIGGIFKAEAKTAPQNFFGIQG